MFNPTIKFGMLLSSGYAFTLIACMLAYASYDIRQAVGGLNLYSTAFWFGVWYVMPTFTTLIAGLIFLYWLNSKIQQRV